jgi:ABC-type transport system involved in multi-copper enzyme maturation permease subunit
MNRVFSSEWLKIARKANLLGWMGPVVLFAFMGTMFNFMDASTSAGQFRGPFGIAPGPEQLAAPDGWIIGIYSASSFIGLIALAIFATNLARDYEKGTIRILLVTQPHRLRLLIGKLFALSAFVVLITAGAAVVTIVASLALAPSQNVAADSWLSWQGIRELLIGFANISLATIIWGLIGGVLAITTRSAAISISAGVGFLLIFELLIGQFAESVGTKLPATVLGALASGGTFSIEYSTALAFSLAYGVASIVVASLIFIRRDVTD